MIVRGRTVDEDTVALLRSEEEILEWVADW